ncbi:MAG: hypothetical protein ACR5LG_02960 [Sodalis sp. (in: enterobacteria)]|uniref:hypothetical protein n=1 Tax=Sodalis sp. (in: enterobacteria) TaxID=1898979 RepID=UPI003F33A066
MFRMHRLLQRRGEEFHIGAEIEIVADAARDSAHVKMGKRCDGISGGDRRWREA